MSRKNIVFVGMPASGKSTVGVIVAKVMGMNFIDSDIVIQQRENAKLNELIEEYGIDDFLKREEQALLSINVDNTVIATGGSAIYSDAGMKHLSNNATIIYLKVSLDNLKDRLTDLKARGVVIRPGESIEQMYATRSVLYEKYADIIVEEKGTSIEDTVCLVMEQLRS
jgi:shikimate kinase